MDLSHDISLDKAIKLVGGIFFNETIGLNEDIK